MESKRASWLSSWPARHAPLLFLLTYLLAASYPAQAQEPDSSRAQQADSLVAEHPTRPIWLSQPPTGKSQKVQGGILMATGGLSVLAGMINLNRKDPCEDIRGAFVECVSNVETVHAVGAIQVGLGIGLVLFGLVRYNKGRRKARVYEEWKRDNASIRPRVGQSEYGLEVGLIYGF